MSGEPSVVVVHPCQIGHASAAETKSGHTDGYDALFDTQPPANDIPCCGEIRSMGRSGAENDSGRGSADAIVLQCLNLTFTT